MPKSLADWLHYSTLKWQMPGVAHRDVGGVWHKYPGELPGWADCGKWLSKPFVRQSSGKGFRWRNPWAGPKSRTYSIKSLCPVCFAAEIRLLQALAGGES